MVALSDKRDEDLEDIDFCSGVNTLGNEDIGDKAIVMTTHSDAHVEVSAGITYFFFYKRRIVVSIEVIINVHICNPSL